VVAVSDFLAQPPPPFLIQEGSLGNPPPRLRWDTRAGSADMVVLAMSDREQRWVRLRNQAWVCDLTSRGGRKQLRAGHLGFAAVVIFFPLMQMLSQTLTSLSVNVLSSGDGVMPTPVETMSYDMVFGSTPDIR
jgi:hypothetical protein